MQKTLVLVAALFVATPALAERVTELNGRHVQLYPTKERAAGFGFGQKSNVSYHNGPVIRSAKVVPIFWGPSDTWGTAATPSALAQHITNFFTQFGTNPEFNVITQYSDMTGSIQLSSLTATYVVDNSTPPTSVTDAVVQGEVSQVLAQLGSNASTIYEVFLPPSSYATYGSWTSCGGPNLQFCAYHSNFTSGGGRHQVRFDAVPRLRRMPVVRLDRRAEFGPLLLARNAGGRDGSRRHGLVRPPGQRGRR